MKVGESVIDKLLISKEVADKLKIKETTIREWARVGKLKSIRVGRYWRFRSQDIENWLRKQEVIHGTSAYQGVCCEG